MIGHFQTRGRSRPRFRFVPIVSYMMLNEYSFCNGQRLRILQFFAGLPPGLFGAHPGHRLMVCDFGLTDAQAEFLRGLGALLGRPPAVASGGVFQCKGALGHYLRHNGQVTENFGTVVWLDAVLTLMEASIGDFQSVIPKCIGRCRSCGLYRAGRPQPWPDDRAIPRCSLGAVRADRGGRRHRFALAIFFQWPVLLPFCRLLDRWHALTLAVDSHPLFEQNMCNVALHRGAGPILALDCEEWQAQGYSLDQVQLLAAAPGRRPSARIGDKNIKTLHATSPAARHLLIAQCRITVRDIDLTGPFKLLFAEPLRMHQLQLLGLFLATHGRSCCGSASAHITLRPSRALSSLPSNHFLSRASRAWPKPLKEIGTATGVFRHRQTKPCRRLSPCAVSSKALL